MGRHLVYWDAVKRPTRQKSSPPQSAPPAAASEPALQGTPAAENPIARVSQAVVGSQYLAMIQSHMQGLRSLYNHPNRVLHYDTVLAAMLAAFYDPALRSLRAMDDFTQCEALAQNLPVDRVARSTLADAMRQMDARHLMPLVGKLMKDLPLLGRVDEDLQALLKRLVAADGTIFTVPADVLWAIGLTRSDGKVGRQIRLNLQLDVLRFMPAQESISLSGADDGSESAAFARDLIAGVIYICDRNFVDFKFIHAVFDIGSDLVVRLKSDTNFVITEERTLTDADRAACVASDRIGTVPGSRNAPGFGDKRLREVIVIDPRSGKPVRLLTNLLDLPARVIGLIYRYRWMIELFFKWLKCVAKVERFISQSKNGITLQLYVAVIGVLLTYLRTGRRPSLYAGNCLRWVASGQMSVQTMLKIVAMRDREREMERARLSRKKSAAASAEKSR